MAAYEVAFDKESGIVKCRFLDALSDADAEAFGQGLKDAIAEARGRTPGVRMLLDNRKAVTFETPTLQALTIEMQANFGPEDRTAVIVPSSLVKMQARAQTLERQETFLSESAALTWLNAWA